MSLDLPRGWFAMLAAKPLVTDLSQQISHFNGC